MKSFHLVALVSASVLASGCALKGDVRRLERQLEDFQLQTARSDSARAVSLARVLDELQGLHNAVLDSIGMHRRALYSLQGEMRSDNTEVQRQLVAIQELMGLSQTRLNELRRQLEARPAVAQPAPGDTTAAPVQPSGPGPEETYTLGMELMRGGSMETARTAFAELLRQYPRDDRAPDAQYQIGKTFEPDLPDSAAAAYQKVLSDYPQAPAAARAMYGLGLLAERSGDTAQARQYFQQVVARFSNTQEAQLAREKLRNQ